MFKLQESLITTSSEYVVDNMLKKYYSNIATSGWNSNLELYSGNTKCITLNNVLYTPYEYVCHLATQSISKGQVEQLVSSWQLISIDKILLSVTGVISFISFNNTYIHKKIFLESFIISIKDNKITHHNIHLRD